MNLNCPTDNKDDSIQKVSAVVTSGQTTGTFSGPTGGTVLYDGKSGSVSGYSSLSGTSTSQLARLLAPPLQPSKPNGFGCWWLLFWIPAFYATGILANILSIPGILLMGTGEYFYSKQIPAIGAIFYALAVICILIAFFISIRTVYRFCARKDRESQAKKEPAYQYELAKWESAMKKWDRLYYCHKHDIVFDPQTRESCAPNLLKEFLYSPNGG